ncbi:MAG: alpha/beta hydrolase [Acidobacteriaceae bacterium]
MTRFLDVRLSSTGGDLATSVGINQGTSLADYQSLPLNQLQRDIRAMNVLVGTHGFNVNRADGIEHLSNWEGLLQLGPSYVFIGLLWPGDSVWAHGLDYPEEPKIANDAGSGLIAPFLNSNFGGVASLSFASHSLGARLVLETVVNLTLPVKRVTLMAGAIDDDCLNTEFQGAASKIQEIRALASKKDTVLSGLFPLGNLLGGIIAEGHPWWHSALGRSGPSQPQPANFLSPFQIPDGWDFNHGNYLQVNPPPLVSVPIPLAQPWADALLPGGGGNGWQEVWTAAFASTLYR